jgi:putative MATE family efflux protein
MAGSILIAQYKGKKDLEKVSFITGQTFSIVMISAIIISIIGYFSSNFLLSFLTKDPLILKDATSYLQISFIAIIAMFIFNLFQSSFRGIGEVKIPMIIILLSVIINFFIDPLFMFGWKFIPAMGVSGVALATWVTEFIAASLGLIYLIKGKHGVKLKLKNLKPNFYWIKKIIKLGIPSSLEHSSRSLGMVLMTFIVSLFGTLTIASFGIGTRVLSFIIIPSVGFSIAVSTLAGNNLGAKQHERVEQIFKKGLLISFSTMTILGLLFFIFASEIATFFVPKELELIQSSSLFIKIIALSFGLIGIQMIVLGMLRAAGRTTLSMMLALLQTILLLIFAGMLSLRFNEVGIWVAYPLANIISASVAYYFYHKKDWLKKELV